MLTVYGYASTRSIRVVWTLEEAGAEYQYVPINLRAGAGSQPDYLALNMSGKVPTLVDSGFVLTESAAICTYIADRFPEARLAPAAGTQERASYNQWCYFAMSELEQPLWTIAKHRFALPKPFRVPSVLETARWEFAVAAEAVCAPAVVPVLPEDWFGVGSGWGGYGATLSQRLTVGGWVAERLPRAGDIARLAVDPARRAEWVAAERALPVYLRNEVVSKSKVTISPDEIGH